MKKNKKKIVVCLISILLIILIILIGLKVLKKDKQEEILEKKELITGISKNVNFNNSSFISVNDNYIIMLKDNKIILNNLLAGDEIETDYEELVDILNSNLLLFKKEKEYILTDNKGNKIDSSNKNNFDVRIDEYTNEVYYKKNNILYDNKGNELLKNNKLSNFFIIINNLLIIDDSDNNIYYFINIKNNKTLVGKSYYRFEDYIIVELKDKYYGYDFKKNIGTYYDNLKEELGGYILSNEEEKIYLNHHKKVSNEKDLKKIIINDKYYLDYENSCGKLVSSEDGNILTKDCFISYKESEYNKELFILYSRNINGDNYVLFPNGTIKKFESDAFYVKDYVFDFNANIYDINAKKIESECVDNLEQAGNNNYYCSNGVYTNLLDNKLNIINKYDEIECTKDYCTIKNDTKYGLLYKSKELIKPTYNNIIIYDKYIIVEDIYSFNVFVIDSTNDLSIEELSIEQYNYDIDIDLIIKEYKLQSVKDIINNNEELFKKYAYIVTHNKNLNGYEKKVLDIFKIVAENKDYLDENYFLDKLSKLKITVKNKLPDKAAGQYSPDDIQIDLLKEYKNDETVYYHELIHFLDYTFNEDKQSYYYKENNKYIFNEEIDKLDKEKRLEIIESGFDTQNSLITEAGAEYYMGTYFRKGKLRTYYVPCRVFIALDYLFGNEKMKEIFFSKNGTYLLKNLFLEYGLTTKEIDKLYDLYYKITYDNYSNNDVAKTADSLVKLYNNKNNKKWTKDKEFSLIIASLLAENDMSYVTSKNKKDYISISNKYNLVFAQKILKSLKLDDDLVANPYYYKNNDKSYIIIDNYKIEYDFKKGKALKYEII